MKTHTFGDSHSVYGWNTVWGIDMHYLGSRLCYSIGNDASFTISNPEYDVQNGDIVIFVFGEIDVRTHIFKYVNETTTYQQVIDKIIHNYFETVKRVTDNFDKLHICVYNIVPPVRKEDSMDNMAFPFRGTNEERKGYALYFNQKLKEKCDESGCIFFDVYDKYTDESGYMNKSLGDGNIHIRDGKYIGEFLGNLKKTLT